MAEYQGQTDQVHKVKLPSAINQAVWDRPAAWAGQNVEALVYTTFVGNGSEIRITIRNKSGRRLGRLEGKVRGNRFRGEWMVSNKAKEAVYFEAELKKHGLKEKSEEMQVIPSIEIANAKWSQPEARRGDILKLTADVTGAPDGTEALIEIYEHDADGAHDFVTKLLTLVNSKKVEAEWEFEYHEDTDDILTDEETEKGYNPPEYFFKVKVGEISADSDILRFRDWVEIRLNDETGQPLSDEDYILYLPDGQEIRGKLDEDGWARVEDVPPGPVVVEFPNLESAESVE